jgi:hypothetical protein
VKLVALGLSPREIAFVFVCTEHEIRNHYEQELEHGLAEVTGMVGGALVKQAIRGDVNAARFFLQARSRWSTPTKVELTGKDGAAIAVEHRRAIMDRVLGLVKEHGEADDTAPKTEERPAGATVQ